MGVVWWLGSDSSPGVILTHSRPTPPLAALLLLQALDELATSAVYLQWVSTGVVPCVEGGGHQRPNKAATVGRGIFIAMERALGDSYGNPGVDELSRLSCRAILPWLPSFSGSFTQAVPLTRIRDIAHRNDIPSDLKQEIKHTIQNKLHRNAGPEDLVATEAMLQRISAVPGQYSAPFVAEFRTFHAELKDFFNARTAFERLDDLQGGLDDTGKGAVNTLRAAKAALDSGTTQQALDDWLRAHGKELGATRGERERELVLATLHAATTVRACLVSMLSSGLRNDAPDSALVTRQGVRNAELALEEYGFVLASRVSTSLEADSASGVSTHWGPPLTACILLLRHLGLSGFRQAECAATEAGLAAARDNPLTGRPDPAATDATLAARAAVQRAQRLAESHSQALMSCFSGRAVTLGTGLGISAASAGVHGEACVRAAVSFPLSNLASWLLRACDAATGGDGTETLVAGTAVGTVISLPRLTPDALASAGVKKQQRVVVLLASADGDEDVSALGVDIAGLVLTQQLPHLSHLAVRARQQHTVLVTCAPGAALAQAAKAAVGKQALLKARPEGGATLSDPPSASAAPTAAAPTAKAASRKAGAVQKASSCALVPLSEATPETCGAKAATCGQLLRVAQKVSVSSPPAAFGAPDGCVLPFGSMEAALREAGTLDRYLQLCGELDAACAAGAPLDALCESAHILLAAARPPGGVLDKVQQRVSSRQAFVCVRSSANVEDLEGMSGAGLYTSLAGIPVADINALGGAVAAVWASLHTPRAVRARAAAGVRQGDAVMAVLLQEQVPSQLAFVLHTQAPGNKALVLAELCVGHGETLASGARGSGWRLEVGPPGVGAAPGAASGVTTRSFANFSTAALPPKPGVPGMVEVRVDYSRQALTVDPKARETLGARLGAVGRALQAELGGVAQDVEGAVVGDAIVVVQSRPQPL